MPRLNTGLKSKPHVLLRVVRPVRKGWRARKPAVRSQV